jgi:hypothetical protein
MTYVRGALSGAAAIFLALTLTMMGTTFRGVAASKATGLGALAAGVVEAALSPLFWISAVLIGTFFFWAGGQDNRVRRVLLFWVPTILICLPGLGLTALIGFVFLLARQG